MSANDAENEFTEEITANVEFLGGRARELVNAEIDRARGLDTKAGGLLAANLALLVAGMTVATKLPDLEGGHGAKVLWAATLGAGLGLLLCTLGLAVAALVPRAFRVEVHIDELERWTTPRVLDRAPTKTRGELLAGDVAAVKKSRAVNHTKGKRLTWAFVVFSAALVCIVASTFSVAIHAAKQEQTNRGRRTPSIHRAASKRERPALFGTAPARSRQAAFRYAQARRIPARGRVPALQ